MSNDWWGNSASPSTPLRQNSLGRSSNQNNRFNDVLDDEDAKMADGVKFLPSFSASTAGKLLGGSSATPGNGLGMSSSSGAGPGSPGGFSPPGMSVRRSPNTRFGDASSPRASRMRQVNMVDEDMPPTTSLRDSTDTPTRAVPSQPLQDIIRPSTLTHTPENTTLLIFGPPLETIEQLRNLFESLGTIRSFRPGPEACQWYILEYEDPVSAAYALRKHGEVVAGRYILGVRVGDVGIPSAAPPPDFRMGGNEVARRNNERQIGTPIRMQTSSVLKAPGSGVKQTKRDEGYGWEEEEGKGNWILEKLGFCFYVPGHDNDAYMYSMKPEQQEVLREMRRSNLRETGKERIESVKLNGMWMVASSGGK